MTAPMTLHGSTLPTYIVKCIFNCSYQLDNTLTADLKKMDCKFIAKRKRKEPFFQWCYVLFDNKKSH
jgi:hypothetical protein